MDWPDAIPVEIPPQLDQDDKHNIPVLPPRHEINISEIPQLESDIDEEEEGQFEDLQTYLTHHNTYQESQNICKEYRKRLLDLNNKRYYRDIDHVYETYGKTRDHIPVNQTPGPCRTMQELIKHMVEEEDKPTGKSFIGINPLEPVHDPYRAEFKERLRKPNTCDRDMQVPNKNFSFYNNLICI